MTTSEKLRDPNLSEEEEDAIIGAFVRRYENERLRERWQVKLKKEHGVVRKEIITTTKPAKIRRLVLGLITVAASLLLLFIFWPSLQQQNGQELLAVYVADISLDATRSTNPDPADSLRRVQFSAFEAADYALAQSSGEILLQLPEATLEDRFHLALIQLKGGQIDAAKTSLQALIDEDTLYRAEAQFHLGLALLLEGDKTTSLDKLRQIQASDGRELYEKAQTLLRQKWE
ncbi:MAG: tetratricopeptide repeat protein [Bacteroidota bacterium]